MMNIFLNEFYEQCQEYEIIIATDGAPRHPSGSRDKYDNIRVIRQPPYSPEVSSVGHIWEYIRENDFHNCQFETSDISEDESEENKDIVKSVTGFHRATVNILIANLYHANPLSNVVFPYFVIQEYRKRYTLFENKLVSD